MSEKTSFWDKFDVVNSFISSVILVAIPLVIKIGADNIAQSLETGRIIQQLIGDLTAKDTQVRQDIALVALDAAIEPKQKCNFLGLWGCRINESVNDQVVDISIIVLKDLKSESALAADIIRKRRPTQAEDIIKKAVSSVASPAAVSAPNLQKEELQQSEIERKSEAAQVAADILAPAASNSSSSNLAGVRIVYIQYNNNKPKAEALQKYLEDNGVVVPGIEQISGVSSNSIRYPGATNKQAADSLRNAIEQTQGIRFERLLDLSTSGYRVPDGQFEIWLKE